MDKPIRRRFKLLMIALSAATVVVTTMMIVGVRQGDRAQDPKRPTNVPTGAVAVSIPKSNYLWKYCWYDPQDSDDHCRVFNGNGLIIIDDTFDPYDGGPPVPSEELRIDSRRSFGDWVWLENGRILLPRSDFDQVKNLLDGIIGKGKS